jgi:hypothetical protein
MDIQVSHDIIEKTTECTKNFSCLSGDRKCLCEIKGRPSESILVVKPPNDEVFSLKRVKCDPYCFIFGSSYVCKCPVRQEIYRLYNT